MKVIGKGCLDGGERTRSVRRIAEEEVDIAITQVGAGVDTLGGKVDAGRVREQRRRVEIVEDGDIDLAGAAQ